MPGGRPRRPEAVSVSTYAVCGDLIFDIIPKQAMPLAPDFGGQQERHWTMRMVTLSCTSI